MEQKSVIFTLFIVIFTQLAFVQGCNIREIEINQGPINAHPSGIPAYLVEINNVCSTGCDISNIHVRCGEFSSATVINPNVFHRLAVDDCLVKGGQPLPFGQTVSFIYYNTFPYSLTVSSVSC
ncbi:protein TAPETUM DETERMINANT 1-like [Neltuma alba]|uniref:protein TAPETUM DETERMINANT 1-like n=1 Tax=Neltuma alba TaxID=207710 RepID=UPI0010A385F3|nr:protein TAPETUM DETERMINANT 1-like [Prosopis alba]